MESQPPFWKRWVELKSPPSTTVSHTTWSDSVCGDWGGVKGIGDYGEKMSVWVRILLTGKEPIVANFPCRTEFSF